MHLKRCNLTGCRVKSRLNYCTPGSQLHLDPYEDEHRCYQHTEIFKINLQHRFLHKRFKYKQQSSNAQRKLKLSSKYNTITTTTIKGELHILPTDVTPTCPIFTGKTGPTRRSNPEEAAVQSRTHRSPRSQRGHNLLKRGYNNNPEYTNTQQGLPDFGNT